MALDSFNPSFRPSKATKKTRARSRSSSVRPSIDHYKPPQRRLNAAATRTRRGAKAPFAAKEPLGLTGQGVTALAGQRNA